MIVLIVLLVVAAATWGGLAVHPLLWLFLLVAVLIVVADRGGRVP